MRTAGSGREKRFRRKGHTSQTCREKKNDKPKRKNGPRGYLEDKLGYGGAKDTQGKM